ncbi:DUF2145 domain-containing protein [Candidatus Contendibacter odensensis]|uniref:DUF2145 domain-containing protein n=1 Tax=Candidatus Contendobacter odensis Run_B_J11 TaxID=1400861 RepID=A0A7U7J1H2_9GAMM|nr:DUF2145 domain-containing protein [Candidatus Contendobacter odensis]CDH43207.1 conserved exported hypothetical protein [Candidatus Contendobacter odensis Run_B_J11]
MNRHRRRIRSGVLTLIGTCTLVFLATTALAGTACTQKPLTPEGLAKASRLGVKLFSTLDSNNAEVVMIGRVGADLSNYGLRFSHLGFALRNDPKGQWTVIHLLNRCGTDSSSLYDEGLITFFLDDPFAYEVIVAVPNPELQRALVKVLRSGTVWRLHQAHYNTIAHPQSLDFQNSNQWLLELVVAAMAKGVVNSRSEVQQHPLMQQYQPDVIAIDRLTRLGSGLFKANLTFTDHSLADRLKGEYHIVSVRSVIRFLHRTGMLERLLWLDLQSAPKTFTGADLDRVLGRL